MSWVYWKQTTKLPDTESYAVGFVSGPATLQRVATVATEDEAAARVHYLNGGAAPPRPVIAIERPAPADEPATPPALPPTRVNGRPIEGPPRSGRALYGWAKDQETTFDVPLVKYLTTWGRLQDYPARWSDWTPPQVATALEEANRKLARSQRSDEEVTR